ARRNRLPGLPRRRPVAGHRAGQRHQGPAQPDAREGVAPAPADRKGAPAVTVLSQLRSGLPPTDYYAPNFQVEVEGRELDPQTKGDVLDVKVTMDQENLTSFDLTFN